MDQSPDILKELIKESKSREIATLLRYLDNRNAVPPVQHDPTLRTEGEFNATDSKRGRISLKDKNTKDLSVLLHELAHSADSQFSWQRYFPENDSKESAQFEQGYDKLIRKPREVFDKSPERDQVDILLQKLAPQWANKNRAYRTLPKEARAFAVESTDPSYREYEKTPNHVNSTLATEFMILLDLAERAMRKGDK